MSKIIAFSTRSGYFRAIGRVPPEPTTMVKIIVTAAAVLSLTLLAMNFSTGEKKIEEEVAHLYGARSAEFEQALGNLLGPAVLGGNKVTTLINGDQIFPAMLAAIDSAKESIAFETYIYWSGEIGAAFSKALSNKAKSGVNVHVMLDWIGAGKIDEAFLEEMNQAGVKVERYHPVRWYTLSKLNNRTHRKLLIVDGRIGFTGGVGIADVWKGNAQDRDHWRDTHFQLEGPAVLQMQSAFMDNWIKTKAAVLHGNRYFPDVKSAGRTKAQVFKSSANEGSESIRLMYLLAMASAEQMIQIESSYFVPDDLSIATLQSAKKRGVRVEIIVPGPIMDEPLVRRASRARWGDLLAAGVKIYEYQPTMFHCKVMTVDSLFVSVGSTNFDNRSFRLNDEANLNVLDEAFASEQEKIFEEDKKRSKEVTLEIWRARPVKEKIIERLAALLRSQL